MTEYDDFFTNDDKPFSENLNDILLLSNVFDVDIPIEMPRMFNNGSFVNSTSSRKCGVAIVTLMSSLPSGISINNDGDLFGTGTVQLKFYPNFNNFGKIKAIYWNDDENIVINLKNTDGTAIISDIDNGIIDSDDEELSKLQEFIIEIVFDDATLHNFKVIMQNKEGGNYDAKIDIDDVDGLDDRLTSIENKDDQQDDRLDDIESLDITQNTRLTNLETNLNQIHNYKITPSNYEPKIDSNITVSVEVTDKQGLPVTNTSISLLCTKAKPNTYPYQNQTTTLTATTNSQGIATFTVNTNNWGIWDFQVGYVHCQVYVDGWRRVLSSDTYSFYRNQTRAKFILDGVSAGNITWNWQQFTNNASAASIRPVHDIVAQTETGETYILIDSNGKIWYMTANMMRHEEYFFAQIEWEIREADL